MTWLPRWRARRSIPSSGFPAACHALLSSEAQQEAAAAAARAIEFSQFALGAFREAVLGNPGYVELITSEAYTHRTYYMGLVDGANKVTFYDGRLRIVGPERQGTAHVRRGRTTSAMSPSTSSRGRT